MKKLIIQMILIGAVSISSAVASSDTLKINTSIKPPFSTVDGTGFFDRLVHKLFSRLGYNVEIVRLPPERALMSANNAVSDGDLPRIKGLDTKYPNLKLVDEKVLDYNFVAFAQKPAPLDIGWDSLSQKKVAFIVGWKIYENNTPPSSARQMVDNPEQLFTLLKKGRVDFSLYEQFAGENIIRLNGLKDIEAASPPLAIKPMYIYLHEKHGDLNERAAAELKKMKEDGSYTTILKQTLYN